MTRILIEFFILSSVGVAAFLFVAFTIDKRLAGDGRGILSGLLVGADNRLSLSKFQGVLWTLVAITSFITLEAVNLFYGVPINTEIPSNLLVLLGMNATTLVLARSITGYTTGKGNLKVSSATSCVSDLYMTDDQKYPDVMKFQMICWTAVALAVYFIHFFSQGGGPAPVGFPDIDQSLLYLMMVGHGAYLGDKALNTSRLKITGTVPLKIVPGEPFSVLGNFPEGSTGFTLNNSIPLEILGWTSLGEGVAGTRVLIPDGRLISSTPVALSATYGGQVAGPYYVDVLLD